jgi:thioesterase domain-containing protein/acyl carrier protein
MAPARAHLQLGEHWSTEANARLGDGESFGIVGDGTAAGRDGGWLVHPALVDVATGFGVLLTRPEDAGRLHVPVGYDSVRWSAPVSAGCAVHATRRPESSHDLLRVDLAITDPTGLVAVRIDGLQLRPIADPATLGAAVPGVVATPLPTGSGLLDLVEPLGLRPAEGTMWLDRLVASSADRLIATSIDLDALRSVSQGVENAGGGAGPESTSQPAGTTLEQRLTTMWQELLGADSVGPDDDFFDLGGHSLMAIRLMTRIKRDFGVRFDLSTIFEASTVTLLAARIRGERPDIDTELAASDGPGAGRVVPGPVAADQHAERKQLVTISSRGTGRPLYVVHGAGGNVLFLSTLARAMGGERPIHAFQAVGVNDGEIPDVSIEAMASRYVAELCARSSGPYLLGGYSGGGIVALEMARQLLELGEPVAHVILFDSVPPRTPWPGRRERWSRLAMRAVRSGLADVAPYVKRNTKQSLRRFVPERAERVQEHQMQEHALGYVTDDTGFVNLYHYFSAAADRYQLVQYDVDVTVLKADHVWPVHRDDYYWREHVTGSLEWYSVPGDHHSMFYPEHAPALAVTVCDVLRRVEQAGAPAANATVTEP